MRRGCYSIGQFARRASVSVRALRFYDQVGLLAPTGYTEAGYRQYTDDDLGQLQQILALKFLGFSLEEIKGYLRGGSERLAEALGRQKAMMRERRAQLDAVIRAIEKAETLVQTDRWSWDSMIDVMEAIQMEQKDNWVSKYFTPEQQETMRKLSESSYSEEGRAELARRNAARPWTEEDQEKATASWDRVGAELKRLVAAGADPAGAEAQAWAADRDALIRAFTGGHPEVEAGLKRMWENVAAMPAEQRPPPMQLPSEAEQEFTRRALEAYHKAEG